MNVNSPGQTWSNLCGLLPERSEAGARAIHHDTVAHIGMEVFKIPVCLALQIKWLGPDLFVASLVASLQSTDAAPFGTIDREM